MPRALLGGGDRARGLAPGAGAASLDGRDRPRAGRWAAARRAGAVPAAGSYTGAQAADGRRTYRAECSQCHRDDMAGGDQAPPLASDAFLASWNGATVEDLAVRIRDTMPPAREEPLEMARVPEVVAYLLQSNRFGPGERALTATEMGGIVIRH